MLTHLCLKFFEDWHQTDLKKKMISKYQEKKVLIFIYLFIHLFIDSPFFAEGGGGRWGELDGRRLNDLTMQHVESSYIC